MRSLIFIKKTYPRKSARSAKSAFYSYKRNIESLGSNHFLLILR